MAHSFQNADGSSLGHPNVDPELPPSPPPPPPSEAPPTPPPPPPEEGSTPPTRPKSSDKAKEEHEQQQQQSLDPEKTARAADGGSAEAKSDGKSRAKTPKKTPSKAEIKKKGKHFCFVSVAGFKNDAIDVLDRIPEWHPQVKPGVHVCVCVCD